MTRDVSDVTHRKRGRRFEEKSVSWVPGSEEEGWLSLARRGLAVGAHVVWGRWESQVYLSPYVEKPFNSKVIKSFVSELKSRQVFLCFGIPKFYIYEYERSMYISRIPVWPCYTISWFYILTTSTRVYNSFYFCFVFGKQISSMNISCLIFSCDSWSLQLCVHFLGMWLNCIIAITNSNCDCASAWKIPLLIFTSTKLFPPSVNSTLKPSWFPR